MNHRIDRRAFVIGSAAASSALALPFVSSIARAQEPEFKLMLGYSFTPASEEFGATAVSKFKELVETHSDGRIMVDVYAGGLLGDQAVMVQKVQQGIIQATQVSMQNYTQFSPSYNILDFPYLFGGSRDVFEKFLDHPYFSESAFATESESKGLRIVPGMWANLGMRSLGISRRSGVEVREPGQLKGLKIRVTNSRVEQQAFALTPANPVSINWGETYQALQQGACDGLNVAVAPLAMARINETLGSCTFIDATPNAHVTVISKSWFDSLPQELQEVIDRSGREAWAWQKSEQSKLDEHTLATWKEQGITVIRSTPEERQAWVDAIGHQRPEWDQWRERYGKDVYDKVVSIVSEIN